jgi:transposase-like protein
VYLDYGNVAKTTVKITCPTCEIRCASFGTHRNGLRRFRCGQCGKTYTEAHAKPLGAMTIAPEKAVLAIRMLLEGPSVRSIERTIDIHRDTILNLLVVAGEKCEKIMGRYVRNIGVRDVECDETWSFLGQAEKSVNPQASRDAQVFGSPESETTIWNWDLRETREYCSGRVQTKARARYGRLRSLSNLLKRQLGLGPCASNGSEEEKKSSSPRCDPATPFWCTLSSMRMTIIAVLAIAVSLLAQSPQSVADVHVIFVDSLGGSTSGLTQSNLINRLSMSQRFQVTLDRGKADAVLAGSVGASKFKVISAMRLVTQDGRILWTSNASGRSSAIVADYIVKELLKAAVQQEKN